MITVYFVNGRKAVLDPKHVVFVKEDIKRFMLYDPRAVLINWNHVCYVQTREEDHDAE